MRKRNKDEDLHTKEWTLNRVWYLLGLLAFEIFCILWLVFYKKQLIASFIFVAFGVGSLVGILKYWKNYRRKKFLKLIEKDIEEDNKLREKLGMGYDIWKMTTLPNIVKKEKKSE